jgi:hypothetical protein
MLKYLFIFSLDIKLCYRYNRLVSILGNKEAVVHMFPFIITRRLPLSGVLPSFLPQIPLQIHFFLDVGY